MSRFIHTGIVVAAIGMAVSAVAPIGQNAAGAYVVAAAGLAFTVGASWWTWCERRELRAVSAAERAARRIERITARAAARVDAIAAGAIRADAVRVAVASVLERGGVANGHGVRVDAVTGEVSDGVRFVIVDEDGERVDVDAAPDVDETSDDTDDETTGAAA